MDYTTQRLDIDTVREIDSFRGHLQARGLPLKRIELLRNLVRMVREDEPGAGVPKAATPYGLLVVWIGEGPWPHHVEHDGEAAAIGELPEPLRQILAQGSEHRLLAGRKQVVDLDADDGVRVLFEECLDAAGLIGRTHEGQRPRTCRELRLTDDELVGKSLKFTSGPLNGVVRPILINRYNSITVNGVLSET